MFSNRQEFGQRVQRVMIGNKLLAPRRSYTVAVNALLAESGHNYKTFQRGKDRRERDKHYEMVKTWIEARDKVSAPATDRILETSDK